MKKLFGILLICMLLSCFFVACCSVAFVAGASVGKLPHQNWSQSHMMIIPTMYQQAHLLIHLQAKQ